MPTAGKVYLTDNGAALCFDHLGASAKFTGRDISGQPIMEVTKEMADYSIAEGLGKISCECCGAESADPEIFAGHIARVATMSAAELAAVIVPPPKRKIRGIVR